MVEYYTNVKNNYKLDYNNIVDEKTGYDCCRFLVSESMSKNIPLPQMYVHSANPIGSANMMGYINNYFKNCKNYFDLLKSYEIYEFENRQSKWVIGQQKVYEFLGYTWDLPLWKTSIMKFFENNFQR